MFLRAPYNYDTDMVSEETGLYCPEETLTQQHQKDEADINTLVRRFGITGELPTNVRMPQYGDFTAVTDYMSALQAVREAEASFMEMPAEVRARFRNDPQQFLEFCGDERNRAEAEKLGLVVPKEAPAPAQAMPSTPAADPSGGAE